MTLFKDAISDYLTPAPYDAMAKASQPGMAHFAGTGPHGKTCRECLFFNHSPHDYRAKGGKYRGLIEPATCGKYTAITLEVGAKVRDDAAACKYYDENPTPPAGFDKS